MTGVETVYLPVEEESVTPADVELVLEGLHAAAKQTTNKLAKFRVAHAAMRVVDDYVRSERTDPNRDKDEPQPQFADSLAKLPPTALARLRWFIQDSDLTRSLPTTRERHDAEFIGEYTAGEEYQDLVN